MLTADLRVDKAMRKNVQHAYSIIESCNAIVFEWSLNEKNATSFVTENIRMFGYTPEDFYCGDKKDYWNFIYEHDGVEAKKRVYEAREDNLDSFYHEYRIMTRQNEIRWVTEQLKFIKDSEGEILIERGILLDITEIKSLEDRLKKSEERYRNLFNNAPVLMMTFDSKFKIREVNNQFYTLTGYEIGDVERLEVDNLVDEKKVLKHIDSGSNGPIELKLRCKDGAIKYINLFVNSIIKPQIDEYEVIVQDITEKKIENERIKYLSFHDKKTGVYNRTYFDEVMTLIDSQRDYPFSVITGDLNGLKEINSVYGHKVGDEMLTATAKIIRDSVDESAIIARIGGDEFSIILPKADERKTKIICDDIRRKCSEYEGSVSKPSIALGCSTKVDDTILIEDLIRAAEERMYKNKLTVSQGESSWIIQYLEASLREKTYETEAHAHRIKDMALRVGREIGFSDSQMDELSIATLMHDIGKIGIPDTILLKPGKLNDSEWEIMKTHSEIGYKILSTSKRTEQMGQYILHHHEKWDGSGYPAGLNKEEIPIISRIISIVDSYDVIINDRPYKSAMSQDEAFHELRRCAGKQFDPKLTEVFIKLFSE